MEEKLTHSDSEKMAINSDAATILTMQSYDSLKAQETINIQLLQIFSFFYLGCAMLFETFAITTEKCNLSAAGFVLTATLALICMTAILVQYKKNCLEKKKYFLGPHVLDSIAFLLATVGCGLITAKLGINFFGQKKVSHYIQPIAFGLLIGTTLVLATSTLLKTKNKKTLWPFICQIIGLSFLIMGDVQQYRLTDVLPSDGKPLNNFRICIVTFASIASMASIALVFINYNLFLKPCNNPLYLINHNSGNSQKILKQ